MALNPCGRAVDWVRRPYTTQCRFFADLGAPLADIIWYPTSLPFLPFPTSFGSSDWDESPWSRTGQGEVFGEPRKYNGRRAIQGLTGEHFCGTKAQFLDGLPFPGKPSPVRYDTDGIPLCCGREAPVPLALAFALSAVVTYVPPIAPGSDCFTAAPIVGGVPSDWTISPGQSHWFRVSDGTPRTFNSIRTEILEGAGALTRSAQVGFCPFLAQPPFINSSPGCTSYAMGVSGVERYIVIGAVADRPIRYRLTFADGFCVPF